MDKRNCDTAAHLERVRLNQSEYKNRGSTKRFSVLLNNFHMC